MVRVKEELSNFHFSCLKFLLGLYFRVIYTLRSGIQVIICTFLVYLWLNYWGLYKKVFPLLFVHVVVSIKSPVFRARIFELEKLRKLKRLKLLILAFYPHSNDFRICFLEKLKNICCEFTWLLPRSLRLVHPASAFLPLHFLHQRPAQKSQSGDNSSITSSFPLYSSHPSPRKLHFPTQ